MKREKNFQYYDIRDEELMMRLEEPDNLDYNIEFHTLYTKYNDINDDIYNGVVDTKERKIISIKSTDHKLIKLISEVLDKTMLETITFIIDFFINEQ